MLFFTHWMDLGQHLTKKNLQHLYNNAHEETNIQARHQKRQNSDFYFNIVLRIEKAFRLTIQ